MDSSQSFIQSSPYSVSRPRKSQFTFKHLSLLAQSSVHCPLRVIAHIDLDAFYAQCEMVRLDVAEDQPLAVQQWQGLIAINYPARKYGLNRHVNITEAQKLCPELMVQHVATWREGDDKWAYREDSFKHIATDKVSLDPYRLQSRRILATIKEELPAPPMQRVEKASVDEVFLDLSVQIHAELLRRYPELSGPPPYDDPTENLPRPPSTALDWQADALVDLDESETEDDDPDWDDVAMLIGSEIVRDVRRVIREKLKYTCSAGIARNKMIAKLGSGHKKPNQQTIVRNRAVQHFLSSFKFTKIRNLGGKLGEQVVSNFATEELTELLSVPLEQMKSKLGDETGSWLHGVIRGEDMSEVNSRTQIKSMLSAKSFRPSINTFDQAVKWLRIFSADIFNRLVEEGVVENKRRPKTINLHHRQGAQTKSKQLPIPMGKRIDESVLFDLAKTLLGQVIVDGRAWPCANLSLSVGGFEDGVSGNRGIGSFLVKGEEATTVNEAKQHQLPAVEQDDEQTSKRRKMDHAPSIQEFFSKSESTGEQSNDTADDQRALFAELSLPPKEATKEDASELKESSKDPEQQSLDSYFCSSCQKSISKAAREEHEDWHFAKELQAEHKATPSTMQTGNHTRLASRSNAVRSQKGASSNTRGKKPEKGQSRLAFG